MWFKIFFVVGLASGIYGLSKLLFEEEKPKSSNISDDNTNFKYEKFINEHRELDKNQIVNSGLI